MADVEIDTKQENAQHMAGHVENAIGSTILQICVARDNHNAREINTSIWSKSAPIAPMKNSSSEPFTKENVDVKEWTIE